MSMNSKGQDKLVSGRIVWVAGDLFTGNVVRDQITKQVKIDQTTGKPQVEYGFGLSIPKNEANDLIAAIQQEAMQLFQNIPNGFAFKMIDGDSIDSKGVPYSQREGYAGCYVFACKSAKIPPKFFIFENGNNFQVNQGIKCGDYVRVQLGIKAHGAVGQGKPGMYLNPFAVQLSAIGKEIVNTPSGDSIFGTSAPQAPAGYQAPQAPAFPMQSQQTQMPQQPVAPPQPNWNVVPNGQPQQTQMPQQPNNGFPFGNR